MKNKKERQAKLAASLFPLHDYVMHRQGETGRARPFAPGEREKLLEELKALMADPEDENQRAWCEAWITWLNR